MPEPFIIVMKATIKQRVLNNKCSVPLYATQMYRTYIIQVFVLNLSVASAVELLQYMFESQGKTQQSI